MKVLILEHLLNREALADYKNCIEASIETTPDKAEELRCYLETITYNLENAGEMWIPEVVQPEENYDTFQMEAFLQGFIIRFVDKKARFRVVRADITSGDKWVFNRSNPVVDRKETRLLLKRIGR